MSSLLVSRTKLVNASASTIFNLLADPARHREIDGSGTVVGSATGNPQRLSLGASFGMSMKFGLPYRITSKVIEFEEGKAITWRHPGGHTWRYQLDAVSDTQTKVTETFDATTALFPPALTLLKVPARNARSMEATLDRLAAKFAANG